MQWPCLRLLLTLFVFCLLVTCSAVRIGSTFCSTLFILVKQCSGHVWGFRVNGHHLASRSWSLVTNQCCAGMQKVCLAFLLHVSACASWCMVSKCVKLVILPSRRLSSQLQGCLASVLALAGALTTMDCLVCKQFRNKEYWKDSPWTSWSTVTGAFSCCKRCMRFVLMETALQLRTTRNLWTYG